MSDPVLSDFKQHKLEVDAKKNWDLFYKRNGTEFFKDRHWTAREFLELDNLQNHVLLEVGCGCGNAIYPLFEKKRKNVFVYACDFSPRAVQFVKANALYDEDQMNAFQCDVTKDPLCENIPNGSVDICLLIFVLSAILPTKMSDVLINIKKVMKPGGVVLFRDYGLYDHAMLRFGRGHKLDDRLYVRQDGTRAYYFSTEFAQELFISSGFCVLENDYVQRRTVNRKKGVDVPRIFVQGKYAVS